MAKLTQKQKLAVESNSPATLVIAGPGTGKTHILASRVQHLVESQKIDPQNILALTFTEAGAKNMRERVVKFLGTDGYKPEINTFHGFASSLLDEYPEIFGYRYDIEPASEIDQAKIIREILDEMVAEGILKKLRTTEDKYFYRKDITKAISTLKREGFNYENFTKLIQEEEREFKNIPDTEKLSTYRGREGQLKQKYQTQADNIEKNKELAKIYKRYGQKLKEKNLYDFDDMIMRAIEGLKNSRELQHALHTKYRAILVDEYQDTSGAQNKLFFLLVNESPNIFVVGDDDQAIYRFQGATIENFSEFYRKFPEANIVFLQDNFRSPGLLVDAALAIANKNPERVTKALNLPDKVLKARGEFKDTNDISVKEFETANAEHAYIIKEIKKLHEAGEQWAEIAVITKQNKEQEYLAGLMRSAGIPVRLSADADALKDPHVNAFLAMCRAATKPTDSENLLIFLLHPATPVDTATVWDIFAKRDKKQSLYDVLQKEFKDHAIVKTLLKLSASHTTKTGAHWMQEVLTETGMLKWTLKQNDAPYIIANLRTLTDEAKRLQTGNPALNIYGILDHFKAHRDMEIPLKPALDNFAFEDAVTLTTAHKVKGAEFKNVFIVHAADTHWSNSRGRSPKIKLPAAVPSQQQNEADQRRVFYVALTRAKKKLVVSYAKTYPAGISGTEQKEKEVIAASFIEEIKDKIKPEKIKEKAADLPADSATSPGKTSGNLQKEIIKNIITADSFRLNPTSYNAFCQCPRVFLYEHILRVPKIKGKALQYGSAIHLALQKYFETKKQVRNYDLLINTVKKYLKENSTLSEAENKELLERAEKSLKNYYQKYLQNQPEPVYLEYNFRKNEPVFEGVRLNGKIDKVVKLDKNSVKVVDYKTNKNAPSLNAILGRTQDDKAPKNFHQLMFYKLLTETDGEFKYTAQEFALDFVDAGREHTVPIEDSRYREFKEEIKKAWNHIQTLKFLEDSKEFPFCRECKYCALMQPE